MALAIVVAVFLYFLLDRTVFGRALYLIGNNPRAAHLAGLPSKRYLFLAYVTCSLLAAFGSLMLTARTGSGEPNLGGSLMLESIAAAVIGGVSLQGGVGGIIPAILGSIFVTMLSNAMDLLEVGGYVQQILARLRDHRRHLSRPRARDPSLIKTLASLVLRTEPSGSHKRQ